MMLLGSVAVHISITVHRSKADCPESEDMVTVRVMINQLLYLLQWIVEVEYLFDANVWLFPILKQNIVGALLRFFFNQSMLNTVQVLKMRSVKHKQEGQIHSARNIDGLVYSLWSLLPSFCNYPLDTVESFKDLEKALCRSLQEKSDFSGVICSSLQILIRQNKRIVEGKMNSLVRTLAFVNNKQFLTTLQKLQLLIWMC
ncbi:hypothetical protein L6452_36325 [Arctium lappa]|uniref:Uncharacterized protein n=1 Tax=Arctium lappa TaxID=4217 RepID=A0ACB8Y9S4_ARCLA|nr:hypothetical protein L6452_36325 [Arctium lappa]